MTRSNFEASERRKKQHFVSTPIQPGVLALTFRISGPLRREDLKRLKSISQIHSQRVRQLNRQSREIPAMAARQHPDVLGGVQPNICSFWFLLSHDEPRFDSGDGDDNSESVGLRRALDAVVVARDGEVTALVAATGCQGQVG